MTDDLPDLDPTTPFVAVADWLTEELAQELYAARQDLADAAVAVPGCAEEADALRDVLLTIIRRLHDVALVLREHEAGAPVPVGRIEELTQQIARDCWAAEASMAHGREVIERHAERLRSRTSSGDGDGVAGPGRRPVALRCGPPALRPRDAGAGERARARRRHAC
jgi:hypothetical protein